MSIKTKNTYLKIAIVLGCAVISMPVWADHNQGPYAEQRYAKANYDYARVVDAQPITEIVRVPREHEVCQQERSRRRVAEHRSPAPAIFGSILGGVIGHQFGGGHGKTAATIAGAAIGGAIANNAQTRRYPPRYYTVQGQRCHTETQWHNEEQVVAWNVSWKYRGEVYHSTMDDRPGKRIPVRVSVEPVYQ